MCRRVRFGCCFFFHDTATTEIYTLSLHDALPIYGAPHLKLLISGGKYRWPAVFWRAAERAGKDFNINEEVDIVYQLERNYFRNTDTLQLTILDIHR